MASATSHCSLRHAQVMMAIGEAVGIQHYMLRVTRDPSLVALVVPSSVSSLDSFIFFTRTHGRLRLCVIAIRVCLVSVSDCSGCLSGFSFRLSTLHSSDKINTSLLHSSYLGEGEFANTPYASLAVNPKASTPTLQHPQNGLFIRLVVWSSGCFATTTCTLLSPLLSTQRPPHA